MRCGGYLKMSEVNFAKTSEVNFAKTSEVSFVKKGEASFQVACLLFSVWVGNECPVGGFGRL